MEGKLKHLELIQGIVNRMSSNSFTLKGWSITLVAAIFALSIQDVNKDYFILLVYIPIVMFWILDSYYLMKERGYRELYDQIRKLDNDDIDFNLSTEKSGFCDYLMSLLSVGEMLFYAPLIIIVIIIISIIRKESPIETGNYFVFLADNIKNILLK
ncbi:MAG: hypothetical protein KBD93_02530 [Streptococcus sp.]|nr:hypothetical protein [Streptococcus sp.]